ncbi:MAG TPA: diguanylate cyclase, partial [Herpetosiphonaceae bacterium]|nr:diguanylate cyclase [Herpetosiphonaceae bacterium]
SLRLLLEALPIGILFLDRRGRIIYINPASQAIWAGARYVDPEDFGEYKGWWMHNGQPIRTEEWAGYRAIKHGETSIDEEVMIQCFDGTRKIILNSALPLTDNKGRQRGALVVNIDVTARANAETALAEREAQLRKLFEILPVGVSVLDEHEGIVESNAALQRILELSPEVLADRSYLKRRYLRPDMAPLSLDEFPSARAIKEQRIVEDVEIGVVKEDGAIIWINVSAAPLPTSEHQAVVVTSDRTARKEAEAELLRAHAEIEAINRRLEAALKREQSLARTDSLTGIANRRHFFDLANHALAVAKRYGHPLSLILFDLDHFKRINDTWGHQYGDSVLQQVVRFAQGCLRDTDLYARYGGEEFMVLLPQSDGAEALGVAERIRQAVAEQDFITPQGATEVTVSLGIASLDGPDDTLESLIGRADEAMYQAKAGGRNRSAVADGAASAEPATP